MDIKKISICIILFVLYVAVKTEATNSNEGVTSTVSIDFSDDEKSYITDLKEKGKLVIATRIRGDIYSPQPDGTVGGFAYNMAKSLADHIGVELEINVVSFKDYYSIGGVIPGRVKTDPDYRYSPNLLDRVDLCVDTMTILPWREKLLRFIKIIPTRQLLITRKGEEIKTADELKGRIITIIASSSYEESFRRIETELKIKFEYNFLNDNASVEKMVTENPGYVTALDSNRALNTIQRNRKLSACIPLSDIQYLGWAVKKDNTVFASIVEKYILFARKTGVMNKYWQQHYNVSLLEYLKLIDIKP